MYQVKEDVVGLDSIGKLLDQIGRYKLLTPNQEIEYGRQVQAMMQILDRQSALNDKLDRTPTEDELAEESGLLVSELRSVLRCGRRAKDVMINHNLKLVFTVAKKYETDRIPLMDLFQEGVFGLVRAIEKFDPSRGYRFSTYAYDWIAQAITRAISSESRTVRLPLYLDEVLIRMRKYTRLFQVEYGREPRTFKELADFSKGKLTIEKMQKATNAQHLAAVSSLNALIRSAQDVERIDTVILSDRQTPLEIVSNKMRDEALRDVLSRMPEDDRTVLEMRYGLDDGQPKTWVEIGRKLGVKPDHVRVIQTRGMRQLRRYPYSYYLQDFAV